MNYMMEKEITEQSDIIGSLIEKYIVDNKINYSIDTEFCDIVLVASGSSYNAAVVSKHFFENISKIKVSVEYASEFAFKEVQFSPKTLYIFISQSGKSADTLKAFKKAKNKGAKTLCITNNLDSPMHKDADYNFYINAGMEYAIAATKTFSASVCALWIIALSFSQNIENEIVEAKDFSKNLADLKIENIDLAADEISKLNGFSILGCEQNFALAKEAALKIKETSYIAASAYPMGEFVHGHFAILNKLNSILIFMDKNSKKREYELLEKIKKTYQTKTIIVSDNEINADILVKIPSYNSRFMTILAQIITLQTLAFKVATALNYDVDKPLGLNKVVEDRK